LWAKLNPYTDGIKGVEHHKLLKRLAGNKVYIIGDAEFHIGSKLVICEVTSSTKHYLRSVDITAQCSGTGVYCPHNLKNINNVGMIHKDEDLRTVGQCVLSWDLYRAGLKLLPRATYGTGKNIEIGFMLPDGPCGIPGHLSNGADGLHHTPERYVVPKTVDLQAVQAVSYANGAQNSVAARLQVTRIGGGASLLSNRLSFMLLASKTLDSPSVKFSELNSKASSAKCYVKLDHQTGGSKALVLNQMQMMQRSMARQYENLLRAKLRDSAPVLPYFSPCSAETPSLLRRSVVDVIVHEVVGMVSDTGRLDGGDSATGECDFALELLRAVGPGGGSVMMPVPCLFRNAPDLPYSRLAPIGPPSMTRKAAVAEAIEDLGGDTFFLLAQNKGSCSKPDWQFDTSGQGGLPQKLVSFKSTTGRFEFVFMSGTKRTKYVTVNKLEGTDAIDVAHLDLKIAVAGAPNRTTYKNTTTYKRRGPASPIILTIYRDII